MTNRLTAEEALLSLAMAETPAEVHAARLAVIRCGALAQAWPDEDTPPRAGGYALGQKLPPVDRDLLIQPAVHVTRGGTPAARVPLIEHRTHPERTGP